MARANRAFVTRAVTHLVTDRGIRQLLDVGSGIPAADNVHQIAQRLAPDTRVVYVDSDPIVAVHSRALLTSTPEGRTAFFLADARDPHTILEYPILAATLDDTRPVALMLVSMLMYFPADQAHHIVTTLTEALPSGSHLCISHPTADFNPAAATRAVAAARKRGAVYHPRTRTEVEKFFTGHDLVDPGVVPLLAWKPDHDNVDPESVYYWAGMARID